MKPLTLFIVPNPCLREKSQEVSPNDLSTFSEFIEQMTFTMYEAHGIGIAAPQVGKNIRLVIIDTDRGPIVLANPRILKASSELLIGEEGCLSVPGKYGKVQRHKSVKVSALDREGKKITFSAKNLFSRVIQHEIDHLDGILFIDRISEESTIVSKEAPL
jgi:peptide deformylase